MFSIPIETIPSSIVYYLHEGFWDEHGDPRAKSYPMMGSFANVCTIILVYLLSVLVIGPRLMHNRKAFSLKPLLIVYNLSMSLSNAVFLVLFLVYYNWGREIFNFAYPPLADNRPETVAKISIQFAYALTKYVDLLDTVFFVLRKKHNQASFLHVYHHSMVALMAWVYFRMTPAFHVTAHHFELWNTMIHSLMYAYYGLAAHGPAIQPYLWWKRYLTQLQIVQFVCIFVHGLCFCALQSGYPLFFLMDVMLQATMYLWMFGRFYVNSYLGKNEVKNQPIDKID